MKIEDKVIEFGKEHLENVIMLDAIAGGSGFYGHPVTRCVADDFAFGEDYLLSNSEMYTDPKTQEIREKAEEDVMDLRKEFAIKSNPLNKVQKLISLAKSIKNPYQRRVRLDQAKSLVVLADVLLTDVGLKEDTLNYIDSLIKITGVRPALIPDEELLHEHKRKILELMGYSKDTPLNEAASEWRNKIGLLDKESMGAAYKNSSLLMLDILKKNKLIPSDAQLKVEILKEARFQGFFAYGNKNGDIHGETCTVESDTNCIFDIINIASHEIGGHYLLCVLFHEYGLETGDLYGMTGVMACNQAVIHEGYADCAIDIFESDLKSSVADLGFGLERMNPKEVQKNFKIGNALDVLATVSLGLVIAKFFHYKNIDKKGIEREFIEFGIDPHRAKTRAKTITKGNRRFHSYCYAGPGYYPGMAVVEKILKKYGPKRALRNICTDLGPCSLSTLNSML